MQGRGLEMMRKLALILALCMGIAAVPAFALGLGEIELQSSLNEPLRAEIPLFAVRAGQRDLITARVADSEAFARAGIEYYPVLSDIRFAVVAGPTSDQAVLQLKSRTPVREPFLSMLIEVTWPEGRLIREYTALLDPPGTARAPISRARPADSGGLATRPYAPAAEPDQPRVSDRGAHEYGPVRADETLWSIAYAQRPSDSITMDQMMLAIYEANPQAFDGSINRIRAGSMLRIPSAESIRATGPDQARRELRGQRREAPSRSEAAREEPAPPSVAPPPAEAEPAAPPKPKGELRLSTPEGAAPAPTPPAAETGPTTAPPPVVEEAPAVPPPATAEAAPPAAADAPTPAATTARGTAPIEIRDNSAKALELLAAHAREYSAREAPGDAPTAEATPAPAPSAPAPTPPVAEAPTIPPAEPAAPAAPAEPTPPAAVTPPAPATPPAESPFADQPTEAVPSSPATPAPPSAEQAPPAAPAPVSPAPPPVAPDSDGLLDTLDPLMLGLIAAAVLLIGLGAVKLRQRRRRPSVELAPIVLSEVEPPAHAFGQTLEAPKPAARMGDTLQQTTPPAARTIETTMQSTMPPERTTQQYMAVSTPQAAPAPVQPPPAEAAAPGGVDPYADALSEVDIHIAYGLYDEAARLLQEPLAKSPERKDLHLKLLEVYFSANLPNEFEAQARTMRSIVGSDTDPEWQKACIMGQQLCPTSPLFAAGASAAAGAGLGATPDMDFSSLLGSAQAAPAQAAAPSTSPSLDFAGLDLGLDKAATVKPPPRPAPPSPAPAAPAAPAAEANTLDFNLEDFKLDVPAAVSAPPAAAPDDAGLDIDLSDFDVGAPATAAPTPAPAAPGGGANEISVDDLLTADSAEGAAEQADTRLDLARAYMDMGEPAMAQSLLQEVIAQGNSGQKQEAQELLNRLNAG